MDQKITLDFSGGSSTTFKLQADIFDTIIGNNFISNLPYNDIDLINWGSEVYGAININLGTDKPQATIPEGGLAYTNQGNYFCIFYGQTPAWPVEYIGQIETDTWKILLKTIAKKLMLRLAE